MTAEGISAPALLADLEHAVVPVTPVRLAIRLGDLWKSSRPTNNLQADPWLVETTRLLADLPEVILSEAIDDAVKASLLGFMPTVGEIRARAVPVLDRARRQIARLRVVIHGERGRARYPWEPEERVIADEDRCTPAEAAAIIRRAGLGMSTATA